MFCFVGHGDIVQLVPLGVKCFFDSSADNINMKHELPKRLRELRNERGLAQAKLAEELGVNKAFIGLIETGKSSVSIDTLIMLAEYFGVTPDYLLGYRD